MQSGAFLLGPVLGAAMYTALPLSMPLGLLIAGPVLLWFFISGDVLLLLTLVSALLVLPNKVDNAETPARVVLMTILVGFISIQLGRNY